MRVISQDGMQDIPYKKFVFSITKDNRIVATIGCTAPPTELYMSSNCKIFYTRKSHESNGNVEKCLYRDASCFSKYRTFRKV